jgi:hypothetical protein
VTAVAPRGPEDEPHQVIAYRQHPVCGPGEERAYCAKPGCGWTFNGIGQYDHEKAEHEKLNTIEEEP